MFDDEVPLWQNKWAQAGFVLLFAGILYLIASAFVESRPVLNMIWDGFVCFAGLFIWVAFFSQFVLPARSVGERFNIFKHLLLYVFEPVSLGLVKHGPAIFIENGVPRMREGEKEEKGAGVIWLDSASAAMLRTPTKFTRAVGPGLVFTKKNEKIAGTVDLHQQTYSIGPNDTEDSFNTPASSDNFADVDKRRWETSAMTRDGVEVVVSLGVNFRLTSKGFDPKNPTEYEGGTPFGFNAESVERLIRSVGPVADVSVPVVSRLPLFLAVDVWREYVRKFSFSQLYEIQPGGQQTGLQIIGKMAGERLTKPLVQQYGDVGQPLFETNEQGQQVLDAQGNPIPLMGESREFKKVQEIGYTILNVNVKRVQFPQEAEDRLLGQWTTTWLKNAQKERDQVDRLRVQREGLGKQDAIRQFALDASKYIAQQFPLSPDAQDAEAELRSIQVGDAYLAELLVRGTLQSAVRNPALKRRFSGEEHELSELVRRLREKGGSNDEPA